MLQNNSNEKNSQPCEVMTFQFSENQTTVRTILENEDVYFVGSDVATILGYKNPRKAINDHCKGVTKRYILTKGGKQNMNVIKEGDVFRLIIHSELPSAQKFESWVMDELLPTIRKKGYYGVKPNQKNDFTDARDEIYDKKEVNGRMVRFIELDGEVWISLNDYHAAIGCRTDSGQAAKQLNKKSILAKKIWLHGNTHPSWFTNERGAKLIALGSRVLANSMQLNLNFGGQA